jgi:hypothetical protein
MDDKASTSPTPSEPAQPPTAKTQTKKRWSVGRIIRLVVVGLVGLFLVIQVVPYGRDHTNPPVTAAVSWPDAESEAIARGACYDCHSNETTWTWYSNVAPASWYVSHDVAEGRATMNFSEWNRPQPDLDEVKQVLTEGEMPPMSYQWLHDLGRLTSGERDQLLAALEQVYASQPPPA